MAVQSGVIFFDGRLGEGACADLVTRLESIAPGDASSIAEENVAMAFGASSLWTGEDRCRQPLRAASGRLMTWDGRLDNRDDLSLQLFGRLEADTPDAVIAMAAFERWGVDAFGSLIGDWSLAIWDARTRTLHLARDYMGVRPLYYHADERSAMWSTSLGELALRSGRVDDLNEAFVAGLMTLQFSTDVTPYTGIRGVPTASSVSFSRNRVEARRRFWHLEPAEVRYRDRRRYEEHLRALWAEAVGSRLRTGSVVWAELSGGLDSSSLVCMADALVRGERVAAAGLRTVSHVAFDSPEGDERRFVAEVDAWTGRRTDLIGVEQHDEESRPDWEWITPLAPGGVKAYSIRHVREAGGHLVLTGRVGDSVMGAVPDNSVAVFDDLRALDPRAALSHLRQWSRASRKPFLEIAGALAAEAMGVGRHDAELGVDLLTSRLKEHLLDTKSPDPARAFRLAQRRQARLILTYMEQARLENWAEAGSVTQAHPFAHRPLVEFMLAVPGHELSAPGTTRALMRRAFAGFVPDRILRRISKGHYAPAALRAARVACRALLPVGRLECVERGWVDPARLDADVHRFVRGGESTESGVRQVLSLERWLASRHQRGPAAIPTGKEVKTNGVRIA